MGASSANAPDSPTHPRPTGHLWVIPVINDMGLALFSRGGVTRGRRPGKESLTPQRAKGSDCCGPPLPILSTLVRLSSRTSSSSPLSPCHLPPPMTNSAAIQAPWLQDSRFILEAGPSPEGQSRGLSSTEGKQNIHQNSALSRSILSYFGVLNWPGA